MTDSTEHILIPVDDSDPSERAIDFVHDRFSGSETRITLLHVIPSGSPMTDTRVFQEAAKREEVEELLAEYKQRLGEKELDVSVSITEGTPDREIVDFAVENDISQIIIGSHGRRGINRVLLGSVAEKVVRRAPMPVTVVRQN
ncbi:MAG: universal stress protein [Natronomonas sp.]